MRRHVPSDGESLVLHTIYLHTLLSPHLIIALCQSLWKWMADSVCWFNPATCDKFPSPLLPYMLCSTKQACGHFSVPHGPLDSLWSLSWHSYHWVAWGMMSVCICVWSTSLSSRSWCHSCLWSLGRSALGPRWAGRTSLRRQVAARGTRVLGRLSPWRAGPMRHEVSRGNWLPLLPFEPVGLQYMWLRFCTAQ